MQKPKYTLAASTGDQLRVKTIPQSSQDWTCWLIRSKVRPCNAQRVYKKEIASQTLEASVSM